MATRPRNNPPSPSEPDYDADTGEVMPDGPRAVAVQDFGRTAHTGFEVVQYVSIPMLTDREVPPGVSIVAHFAEAAKVMPPLEGQKAKFPGDFWCSVIKAQNGEARLFPWSTVFKSEMERTYPNASYVGKWFQITRLPMKRGKTYWTFAIAEVRPRLAQAA